MSKVMPPAKQGAFWSTDRLYPVFLRLELEAPTDAKRPRSVQRDQLLTNKGVRGDIEEARRPCIVGPETRPDAVGTVIRFPLV